MQPPGWKISESQGQTARVGGERRGWWVLLKNCCFGQVNLSPSLMYMLRYYYYVPLGDWFVCVADTETRSASPGMRQEWQEVRAEQQEGCVAFSPQTLAPLQTCQSISPNLWECWRPRDCERNPCLFAALRQSSHLSQSPEPWAISGVFGCIRECVNYGNNTTNMA